MKPEPPWARRLTAEQARSITVEGASVALGAGAGCGKTTVLSARYLTEIDAEKRRALRSIVALTFTEKAARELRQRIRKECRDRLSSGVGAETDAGDDVPRWRSVLRGLEAAPIGTFHEFCGQWLRRHAVDAGIDPDFTILDVSIAGTIRDEALGRCLREWLADVDPDLIGLAVEYGLTSVRQALADLVARRAVGDLDAWAERPVEEIIALWQAAWADQGRPARLQKVARAAMKCAAFLSAHRSSHPKMIERRAYLLEHLPGIGGADVSDDMLREIREQAKVSGAGRKESWESEEIYRQVQKHFEDVRAQIGDFSKGIESNEAATREAAEAGRRLARLASRLNRAYAAAKRARGGLDFDDLLILTRDLLRARPDLAGTTPEDSFARLLVDEFQDTDEVQGEILRRLGGEEFASGRLYLVGDPKQSIYRFRGAQPRIFQDFRAQFPPPGHLALTENFRSVPAILDFVNALFAGTFPERDHRLVPGPLAFEPDDRPAVEFLWASESEPESDSESGSELKPRSQVSDRRKVEARWIARRLREVLDSGSTVRDQKTRVRRRAEPRDIALLFRSMTDVGSYESALADEGFEYHVVGGAAFYAQQEVHDLINVLSVIEDPLDAVSMVGALRSPFFCLSDDGLYWLATWRSGDLDEALRHADEVAELSDLDRRHATRARDLLGRWRDLKDRVPIATMVDRVLDESGYEAALPGEFLGARKRANARKLVRRAREFDQQGGFTVADFVARLRADLRRPPREEHAATTVEEGTSIRLMSVHQAKGLEFPIVVLPDLNRAPVVDRNFVAFHPVLGPLVRPGKDFEPGAEESETGGDAGSETSGTSLGWMTYQAIEQRAEYEEALRLFYVATTRARDLLILSAGIDPDERARTPALSLLFDRFDRATGACLAPLPEGWASPCIHVTSVAPRSSEVSHRDRRGRPDLRAVAEVIQGTAVRPEETSDSTRPRRPHFVDLDPAPGLPPAQSRLDRLVRAILIDPGTFGRPEDLARVAARAARRQQPSASTGLIAQALDRLRPWVEGPFGRALAGGSEIERGVSWMMVWPPQGPDRTVFQGAIDLLYRDRQGDWNAVVVGIAEAPAPRERLRLLLGSIAVVSLGFGPIRRAWHLRLGPGGGLHGEDQFDARSIDAAVREAIGSPS